MPLTWGDDMITTIWLLTGHIMLTEIDDWLHKSNMVCSLGFNCVAYSLVLGGPTTIKH